jgi:hypothetical protein
MPLTSFRLARQYIVLKEQGLKFLVKALSGVKGRKEKLAYYSLYIKRI